MTDQSKPLPEYRHGRDLGHPLNHTAHLRWSDGDRLEGRAEESDLLRCLSAMPAEQLARTIESLPVDAKSGVYGALTATNQGLYADIATRAVKAEARAEAAEAALRNAEHGHHGTRHELERTRAKLAEVTDRITTIADEACGLQPVMPVEDVITLIERELFRLRVAGEEIRATVERLEGERDEARRVAVPALEAELRKARGKREYLNYPLGIQIEETDQFRSPTAAELADMKAAADATIGELERKLAVLRTETPDARERETE
jgi:hypothetical protein